MRDIAAFRAGIRNCIAALPAFAQDSGDRYVLSLLAVRVARILSEGILRNGVEGSFFEYSEFKGNTDKFKGKELNQAGKAFIAKNRLASWQDFRIAQGLTNTYVNLSYSNRMLNSLTIIERTSRVDRYVARIGTTDPVVLTYIGDLKRRYGNFIRPTRTELENARQDHFNELKLFLKRYI